MYITSCNIIILYSIILYVFCGRVHVLCSGKLCMAVGACVVLSLFSVVLSCRMCCIVCGSTVCTTWIYSFTVFLLFSINYMYVCGLSQLNDTSVQVDKHSISTA